jgi:hypothetical protein
MCNIIFEKQICDFESRVLSRIFGPKREEVTVGQKKLHEKFCNLCCSPNIIKVMEFRRMR